MSGEHALVFHERSDLEALFVSLAAELKSVGGTADVLMVGGSWLLWSGDAVATRDVDSAQRLSVQAIAAIARVAERHGLDSDWLNDSATTFLPSGHDHRKSTVVFEAGGLVVRTPPAETIS